MDGSHRFHEVFVDLSFFLRKIVRPGGAIVLDDHWWPSVRIAAHDFEAGRSRAPSTFEPAFEHFQPF